MAITGQVAKGVGGGLIRTLGTFFKRGLLFIFLLIIVINAISLGVKEKSIEPVITELGGRFLHTTQELQIMSLNVIEKGGVYERSQYFWGGVWNFMVEYSKFFVILYVIYLWLKLGAFIVARTPISDTSRWFVNVLISIIFFIILQMILLLVLSEPIEGQSKWDLAMTPLYAFRDFGRSIPLLVKPISGVAETVIDKGYESVNQTLNNTNST